jgi:tRNA(adenine34) deaminase
MKRMKIALQEAIKGLREGEVPVGAAIFKGNDLLAKAHNWVEKKNCILRHAELQVINTASRKLKNWRLTGTTLLVTLEPCLMCFGAIIYSRIDTLIFAAYDSKNGAVSNIKYIPKRLTIVGGVEEAAASNLIRQFFKDLRRK